MNSIISIKNVSKSFPEEKGRRLSVLHDISFEIERGEFFILLGPSGSGKSTLLRILSGLEKGFEGAVTYAKGDEREHVSFVFQQFALLPWLTVFENIELALRSKEKSKEKRRVVIEEELKRFNLQKFSGHHPHELSGGMRQRVGLARAFATKPELIFMDEPFSELDSFSAHELRKELTEIWIERKPTIIMVTHNIPEAIELADRIAVLTNRPGKIEKIIDNNIARPRNLRSEESFAMEDALYQLIKP